MTNTARRDTVNPDKLVWEDPPPPRNGAGRGKYLDIAAALSERTGQWARLPQTYDDYKAAGRVAHHIAQGQYAGFTKGHFKASVRTGPQGSHVYAMHVGPANVKPKVVPDAVA